MLCPISKIHSTTEHSPSGPNVGAWYAPCFWFLRSNQAAQHKTCCICMRCSLYVGSLLGFYQFWDKSECVNVSLNCVMLYSAISKTLFFLSSLFMDISLSCTFLQFVNDSPQHTFHLVQLYMPEMFLQSGFYSPATLHTTYWTCRPYRL
jgi:hypothetical protein